MASATILKLKKRGREERREIILAAAQKLFAKKGISGVNMRDIAREAGVSVGFIYRYFSGQADIFLELFETGATELYERITAAVEGGTDPHPLRVLARTHINYLHENRMFYQMMIYFMLEGKLSDEALQSLNSSLRRIVDGVEAIFRNETGVENPRILAHSFFAALNGIMISFVNYPGRTPREIKSRTLVLADMMAERFEHKSGK